MQAFPRLPYLYLGYGSPVQPKAMRVDDVRVYRNVITDKEIAVPAVSGGEEYRFRQEELLAITHSTIHLPTISMRHKWRINNR